ncbi:MAG: hypothetical protein KC591_00655 [Gemmatimonadetes bacterium]|nr:hypothetical protein [Gemmatimonadota bacterium]
MIRQAVLILLAVYSGVLGYLQWAGRESVVRDVILDPGSPAFGHAHATVSAGLLLASALLLTVVTRSERLAGRSSPAEHGARTRLAWILALVAFEERFRVLPALSGHSPAAERLAWLVFAAVAGPALWTLARSPRGRDVPGPIWLAAGGGFLVTFLADAAHAPLLLEDLPRVWGAGFLFLAGSRMLEASLAETALAGPAGAAWRAGHHATARPALARLTELAGPSEPPEEVAAAATSKKKGIRPEGRMPEPERSSDRSPAAPPRKLLSH